MKQTIIIFANPEFDQRSLGGISKLYQIFCVKYGYNLEIINEDFLKIYIPEPRQVLVIAGGDGTVHRAINAISDECLENYTFGIIPGGTANEFATSFNIPLPVELAAETIMTSQKTINQSLGLINNSKKFLTGFLYGIAYKVLLETSQKAKHYFGEYAYHLPGLLSTINYEDFVKKFKIDNDEFRTGYLLINNLSLGSQKDKFSVVYLSPELEVGDFIRLIVKNQANGNVLLDPAVFFKEIKSLTLEFKNELSFMLDGEVYRLDSPITFTHCSHKIRVIV